MRHISFGTTVIYILQFQLQYMSGAGAEAGAGAKIRDKGGARAKDK